MDVHLISEHYCARRVHPLVQQHHLVAAAFPGLLQLRGGEEEFEGELQKVKGGGGRHTMPQYG